MSQTKTILVVVLENTSNGNGDVETEMLWPILCLFHNGQKTEAKSMLVKMAKGKISWEAAGAMLERPNYSVIGDSVYWQVPDGVNWIVNNGKEIEVSCE